METLKFDMQKDCGAFKPLNATNGGPRHKRHAVDQWITNFEDYKKARIPYSRNHDANLSGSTYGGPFTVDISVIFPNFDADPEDPASYDFACTDESILVALDAGTETFYRLGQSIEHQVKKHDTRPPKDLKKWAVICEHVIRHVNGDFADGLNLNLKYWEIWNEPDLDLYSPTELKKTWGGTAEQFYDFFEIAANHLKGCFPELKIGGPASCGCEEWELAFLQEMHKRNVPLDFFSWHIYAVEPTHIIERSERVRKMMVDNGYEKAESICNEWNYVKGWTADYLYSIETIGSIKGAAFVLATMCAAQKSSIDMLMYYDTRPSVFSGAFDYYTARPKKPYYALYWYGMFYDCVKEVRCKESIPGIYTLCGVDKNGKRMAVITHYSNNDGTRAQDVALDLGAPGEYDIYRLDDATDGQYVKTVGDLSFTLPVYTSLLIKEK